MTEHGSGDEHLDRMMFHHEMLLRHFGAWAESSKLMSIVDRREIFWKLVPTGQLIHANKVEDLDILVGPYTYVERHISVYRQGSLVLIEIYKPEARNASPTSFWVLTATNERQS